MTAAPAPWVAKPCAGSMLIIRVPSVLMIRQPPVNVPSAIAVAEDDHDPIGNVEVIRAGYRRWRSAQE